MTLKGIENDHDLEFLNDHFPSDRAQCWVWHVLWSTVAEFCHIAPGPLAKKEIGIYLRSNPVVLANAQFWMKGGFVPDAEFSWVDNSVLQNNFLRKFLVEKCGFSQPPTVHVSISGRRWVQTFIDCLLCDLPRKIDLLNSARSAWARSIDEKRIFSWFNSEDEAGRCLFAWEWIKRKKESLVVDCLPFKKQEDLLVMFDGSNLTQADKKLIVIDIKRAWSQALYKGNSKGEKQQCSFMLSDCAAERLKEFSKTFKMSKVKVVEELIKGEAERGFYLAQKKSNGTDN